MAAEPLTRPSPTASGTAPAAKLTSATDRPATTPSGRALTRRGADTQQRLLEAAWTVFSERPYPEARITDITTAAGLSTGSYYTYFDSKEELFRVIAREALDEISTSPTRAPENPDHNPVLDIAYASRQFLLACFRHRTILRSIELVQANDAEVRLARRSTLVSNAKRIERWVRRLQDDGYCDVSADPWYTATALQAMNVTLGYEQLVHGDDDTEKIDALVAAITPIWARAVGLDDYLPSAQAGAFSAPVS